MLIPAFVAYSWYPAQREFNDYIGAIPHLFTAHAFVLPKVE
jgi:hypothetical protein